MKQGKASLAILLIANALFWAIAMVGASVFFDGASWSEDITFWLIAGFIAVNGCLLGGVARRSGNTD